MADSAPDAAPAPPLPSSAPDTVDPPAPPPPPPPAEKPAASPPVARAGALLALDGFLSHLFRCLQTRSGADAVLMFACYAARLSGVALETVGRFALHHTARKLVAMAFSLPPKTTVVLSSTPSPPLAVAALKLSARLNALSGMISEWRTMGRLFGLLGLYMGIKGLVLTKTPPSSDPAKRSEQRFNKAVSWAQMLALVSFQLQENMAILAQKKVLPLAPATIQKVALASVRSWAVYVFLDIGRLLVERMRKQDSLSAEEKQAWTEEWSKSLMKSLAWAPLTIHWSMLKGPLPDFMIPVFAIIPSTSGMIDLWRQTA
ncbi:hypothetical protein B0I35DRAFT_106115 [Stachybotrys elegans]|uniref:Uncharacterized protein n=1 Tax=Stachybotrys elegans TaxID=80388 RepID=A0A8K0SKN5_9HYPO|nr:hypothetical protein B0I35DRAFT_106115 [Stachybotrys elegans]